MSLIPQQPRKPKPIPASFLIIIGAPKIGTTEALLALPNALHVDLQEGAIHYGGISVNIVKIAKFAKVKEQDETGKIIERPMKGRYEALRYLLNELEENRKAGKPIYDFIALDPAASLEEIAEELALIFYSNSVYKRADPNDTTSHVKFDIGWNKGVEMLQAAFEQIINEFRNHCNTLILKVHGKDSISITNGKEVTMETLDLHKNIAGWLAKECDSIGSMYRIENNVNKISFVKTTNSLLLGSRSPVLNNNVITISKKLEDGTLQTYWENVFPHIKEAKLKTTPKPETESKPISETTQNQ